MQITNVVNIRSIVMHSSTVNAEPCTVLQWDLRGVFDGRAHNFAKRLVATLGGDDDDQQGESDNHRQ